MWKKIYDNSSFCKHCGNKLEQSIETNTKVDELPTYRKSKGIAIVLSIFFGVFCWLYTYGKNKYKFWISIAIYTAVIYAIVMQYDPNSMLSILSLLPFFSIVSFGLWLWGLIYHTIKPNTFFTDYPNG